MNGVYPFLEKNSSGKKVLTLFILTNLVYLFMLLYTIPLTMEYANGMKLLDILPAGYDLAYVNRLFTVLGPDGRAAYLTKQLPVDMLYPLLFAVNYSLLMAYVLKKLKKFRTPFTWLCLLPIVAGLADYLENFGIFLMLKNYPDISQATVQMTNFFSLVKSGFSTALFLSLILTLAWFGIKTMMGKAKKKFRS